jgi:alpha-N-arabinofuranosidase
MFDAIKSRSSPNETGTKRTKIYSDADWLKESHAQMKKEELIHVFLVLCLMLAGTSAALLGQAANPVVLQIKADQVASHVSPMLYGLMTEEINFSYDGGLYGELVRNRIFKENAKEPVYWQLVQEGGGTGSMALDPSQPFNEAIAASLKLTVTQATGKQSVGIANEGF